MTTQKPEASISEIERLAGILSDRIDLQACDVDQTFYKAICTQCPASTDLVFDVSTLRHRLFCAIQGALLGGDIETVDETFLQVQSKFRDSVELSIVNGLPDCSPARAAQAIHEYCQPYWDNIMNIPQIHISNPEEPDTIAPSILNDVTLGPQKVGWRRLLGFFLKNK